MGQRRLFAVVAVFFRLVFFDGLGGSGALSLLCGGLSLVVGRPRLLFVYTRHMAIVYATLIIKGRKTIDQVPALLRKQVEEILADLEVEV